MIINVYSTLVVLLVLSVHVVEFVVENFEAFHFLLFLHAIAVHVLFVEIDHSQSSIYECHWPLDLFDLRY